MRSSKPLLLIVLLMQLAGCAAPTYYAQAISGHLELMRERESIDTLLETGNIDEDLAIRLQLSQEIRAFAISELGIDAGDSYTQFVKTNRSAVTWNVLAAEEFSLEPKTWCFPIAGCVAYRGYFKQQAAESFAEKLAAKDFDVTVTPATAYSTLGWFDDPLLDTMFQYSDTQLAAFIFHELAHRQLYVKGDTAFNEAYAGFIEETAVRLWLESIGQEQLLESWLARQQATADFTQLLRETRRQLNLLYSSSAATNEKRSRKSALFAELESAYHSLVEIEWGGIDYYSGWFSRGLNNAQMALVDSYQGGICAFSNLYQSADQDIVRFQKLAAEKAALDHEYRRAWLEQPCLIIASDGNL